MRIAGTALLIAASLAGRALAVDTVEVATAGSGGKGRARLVGQVVDYTGKQLILELPGARRQEVPGDRVLRVETEYGRHHQQADALWEKGRFEQALPLYRRALDVDEEPRLWVRRLILAQIVRCYRGLGQFAAAGRTFLLLLESDPDTPYFDCIPLAWVPGQPPPELEQAARSWLARSEAESPAAVLLGASHLLSTSERPGAFERLKRLATSRDRRVAQLAYAQTWRTAVHVDDSELDRWSRAIENMPESYRAGPYFVLGRALGQRERWEDAALAFLRVPILFGGQRALAARSLLEAGRALERLAQPDRASRLYRELQTSYPETRSAQEAGGRLDEIDSARAPRR